MKIYKGQALIIVMVVLIIGLIVVLGMISRTSKNTLKSTEEKTSEKSSQVVNSLIDVSRSITPDEIKKGCASVFSLATPLPCIITFKPNAGGVSGGTISTPAGSSFNLPSADVFPQCAAGATSTDYSELSFEPQYNMEKTTIKKDDVLSIPFSSVNSSSVATCTNMAFNFENISGTTAGIYITKVFVTRDTTGTITGYKPYDPADNLNFVFNNNGAWVGWTAYTGTYNFTDYTSGSFVLDEIRIRAVAGDINVTLTATGCNNVNPFFLKVSASANCASTARSSYYYKTIENTALPIFDYVLYNKTGELKKV